MRVLRKAYHAKVIHLSALFLTLFFSLASLVSCTQPEPLYTSINLGIPAAALQSPVKGHLPDSTELHIGITFKIDPRPQRTWPSTSRDHGQPSVEPAPPRPSGPQGRRWSMKTRSSV